MRTRTIAALACSVLAVCAAVGCSSPASRSDATPVSREASKQENTSPPAAADLATQASFALSVDSSPMLTVGKSSLQTQSAFASLTNEFFGGRVNALKIFFFTQPIPEGAIPALLHGDAEELTRKDYTAFVLYLDDHNAMTQANLTYQIPGTTVTRTVAYTPEALAKGFSDFRFDGKRLQLKGEGTYAAADPDGEKLSLSWTVDLDIPVVDQRKPS